MTFCCTKDGIQIEIHHSSKYAPPFFDGQSPSTSSYWIVIDNNWYNIGQTFQTKSLFKIMSAIKEISFEELQQLLKSIESWTKRSD